MKPALSATVILLLAGTPALAHRLDEYLQGAIVSVKKSRANVQITLTPGVTVFPLLLAEIDTDRDGAISATEQDAYARRILGDLSLRIDGHPLTPQLLSIHVPGVEQMKEGLGEIRIEFSAGFPAGGPNRKLIFENHHQSRIAAYKVNCLVSSDPEIRILTQNRNYSQSWYELDFVQSGVGTTSDRFAWLAGSIQETLVIAVGLFLLTRMAFLWRYRLRPSSGVR